MLSVQAKEQALRHFSVEAFRLAGYDPTTIEVVSSDSLARPAPRPRNSRLKCLLSDAVGLTPLPSWQEGLKHFVTTSKICG